MEFLGNHILSIDQFDKDDIVKVFSIAEKMIPYANREKKTRVLQGAICLLYTSDAADDQ